MILLCWTFLSCNNLVIDPPLFVRFHHIAFPHISITSKLKSSIKRTTRSGYVPDRVTVYLS